MAEKKTHSHSIHMTDELFALVMARMRSGKYPSLNAYFESLVQRETDFLDDAPCENCKLAEALQTLINVASKPPKNGKKKR